ncbi:hypothetical protein GYMLUDRAFT_248470 [Collybiopsis luxurians FD-317 M1]|uniref:Protein kinase domain-containing protein n=1 Tax=Collybiopsis luxurians FD-317 M1 TaxID=944289 RepID=A0A0D0CC48_9AGAR|nr:hypothetical protein GYMLUDRAFT_248470 [Collybiopsis luxurians FD-317 M1]
MSSPSERVSIDEPATHPFRKREELADYEVFWRDHYDWLKEKGYLLRARYRSGWVASWAGTNKFSILCEDSHYQPLFRYNMDAIRIADGKPVMLRRPDSPSVPDELKIGKLLLSNPTDPRNHCVPVHETLYLPESDEKGRNSIIVMPYLVEWDEADFKTVGEVVDFCCQIFEGLQYIHSLNIAHNDKKSTNIMMDWSPLYSDPPHFVRPYKKMDWSGPSKPHTRTTCPVKYYFIDWDLSMEYDRSRSPPPRIRQDMVATGNVIRNKFITGQQIILYSYPPRRNVEFLKDLIADMTHDDPTKRPTMDEVVRHFEEIRKGLSWWKLRSRISAKTVLILFHRLYSPIHRLIQLSYIVRRIPAIPDYTRNKG